MIVNELHSNELNASFQQIKARVELYKGSTLDRICTCGDVLHSFSVERAGANKFFGFGICHKLSATLLDEDKEIDMTTGHTIEVAFGVGNDFLYPYPIFYVEDPKRDGASGALTITAYDALYKAAEHRVSELNVPLPYTIKGYAQACAALLGMPIVFKVDDGSFDLIFETSANFDGTETIRQALDAIAEATQTIYYLDRDWNLTFIRLDKDGEPVFTVAKDSYLDLQCGEIMTLKGIAHTTELGDNIESTNSQIDGVIQYIRDNPFLELRDDAYLLLDNAMGRIGGIGVAQFESSWWGNYLLEIGDKINFVSKDDSVITSYLLDDTVSFDGALSEVSTWDFDIDNTETSSSPTSLGDVLNQTFARVDKVSGEITLAAQTANEAYAASATLRIDVDSINGTVKDMQSVSDEYGEKIGELEKKSESIQTPEQIQHIFTETLKQEGVDEVVTTTGFTFNSEGLTVSKSGNPLSTQITENGMTVYSDNLEMLVANSAGVRAADLHATTYLIIGNNSRLQDTANGRTACYWIGG